jgi:hypothetical protein
VYVLAAAWLALNGILVFHIVRRIMNSHAAIVAALAYMLFPADSIKILTHAAAHVQGAMTFSLLGIWLWLRGGTFRAISYPIAAMALLSYETTFLPFFAVILLWSSDRRTTLRTWGLHLALSAGTVVSVAAIRLSKGDIREAEVISHKSQALYRIVTSLYIGPIASGKALFTASVTGLNHLDPFAAFAAALVVIGFTAAWQSSNDPVREPTPAVWPKWLVTKTPAESSIPWWWLFIVAIVIWSESYALTLINYPPTHTIGRGGSAHVAAAWPASLAFAALCEGLRQRPRCGPRLVAVLFPVWLACIIGYHHYIQREYVRAWRLEKRFWRQVMTLIPEAGPGWTVIVDGIPQESPAAVESNSWADFLTYREIFTSSYDPMGPAFAHIGYLGEAVKFRRTNQQVDWWPQFWCCEFVPIDPSRLALLHDDRGELRRVQEISTPVGKLVATAAPAASPRAEWSSTLVSRLLLSEPPP